MFHHDDKQDAGNLAGTIAELQALAAKGAISEAAFHHLVRGLVARRLACDVQACVDQGIGRTIDAALANIPRVLAGVPAL